MNRFSRQALCLAVVGWIPLQSSAQSPEHYVAQVAAVSGTCRECPHGHPEHSHSISKGTPLAADDDVRCEGRGFVVASYTGSKSYFRMEGSTWQPVGLPGAGENADPNNPREGRVAYNSPDEAVRAGVLPTGRMSQHAVMIGVMPAIPAMPGVSGSAKQEANAIQNQFSPKAAVKAGQGAAAGGGSQ
jgi:hypothetical protein